MGLNWTCTGIDKAIKRCYNKDMKENTVTKEKLDSRDLEATRKEFDKSLDRNCLVFRNKEICDSGKCRRSIHRNVVHWLVSNDLDIALGDEVYFDQGWGQRIIISYLYRGLLFTIVG